MFGRTCMPQNRSRKKLGQSLVETAITLPLLLMLALGVTDIGRAFYYREGVVNATRQAVRLAVNKANHTTGNLACAANGSSPATLTTTIPGSGVSALNTIANQVALESSSNGLPAGSAVNGATLTVTWHCSSGLAVTNSTNGGITDPGDSRSDAISARIVFQLQLITPFIYPFTGPSFTLGQTELGRAEY
ncbi:MAG: hypothetical protein E6I63_03395 [Chloroflexi bacterium]|nr:MAG: hypothetical protein E6I63_03395 [Chloroflexota bacterium]